MSQHRPVFDGHYVTHCECGWGQGVSFGVYNDDMDVRQHVDAERAAEKARKSAEAERIRLLSQGQNWDTP